MQRSIAAILTLVFSWLILAPAFAQSPADTLPACCRKGGKHECALLHAEQPGASDPAVTTISDKCPYAPHSTVASQAHFQALHTSRAIFAGVVQHPAVSPQTDANFRVSYDRSRQKRGPPSLILG
jgi:hypothetical protein